jgi:hypothetical protein
VDATVLLDDKIKADLALSSDCLTEGKKWIDKNAAERRFIPKQSRTNGARSISDFPNFA